MLCFFGGFVGPNHIGDNSQSSYFRFSLAPYWVIGVIFSYFFLDKCVKADMTAEYCMARLLRFAHLGILHSNMPNTGGEQVSHYKRFQRFVLLGNAPLVFAVFGNSNSHLPSHFDWLIHFMLHLQIYSSHQDCTPGSKEFPSQTFRNAHTVHVAQATQAKHKQANKHDKQQKTKVEIFI